MRTLQPMAWALAGLALLAGLIGLRAIDPDPVARLRLSVFDAYQRLSPRVPDGESPVVIVEIDSASLARAGQWPWSRARLAHIVERLGDAGARAIAIDLILSEPDRLSPENLADLAGERPELAPLVRELARQPSNDARLAAAIARAPVVLSLVGESGSGGATPRPRARFALAGDTPERFAPAFRFAAASLPLLVDGAAGLGSANWLPHSDQIVRRVPLLATIGGTLYPSLALEAARVGTKETTLLVRSSGASGLTAFGLQTGIETVRVASHTISTEANGELWLRYRGYDAARSIPAHQVLDGTFDRARIAGRYVLLGVSAPGLLDLRSTPLQTAVPGVAIHAEALEQILGGSNLSRPAYATGMEIVIIAIGGLAVMALLHTLGPVAAALLGVAAVLGVALASWLAFTRAGVLLDPVYPALVLVALYLTTSLSRYIRAERERSFVRAAFSHYLSPPLVEELARNPERLKLGGEMREVSVLFADVRGFTGISEGLEAQALIGLINRIFTPLTDCILAGGGNIDKYMGDAVMACWNAPVAQPEHARQAALTALAMLRALEHLNAERAVHAALAGTRSAPIRLGIGLNTGLCAVGNVGSPERLNYTILGDSVNIAARLQEASKTYGLPIIAGESTALAAPGLAFLEIDAAVLRGKARSERIFALLGDEATARSAPFTSLQSALATARTCAADGRRELALQALSGIATLALPADWPSLTPLVTHLRATLAA